MSLNFANNNLNGHTRVLDGYVTSKTRVCVTVGMMTTGYDCEDLLNVVLLRPIFSPTDFIQIKGRGTRKYTFRFLEKEGGRVQDYTKDKDKFKLFDFFATCEYFEEKFNYDEVIKLPSPRPSGPPPEPPPPPPGQSGYTNVDPDPLKSHIEYAVPVYGMKIDRKFYEQFEDKVKKDEVVRQYWDRGDIRAAEEYIRQKHFDKPEEFYNLDKLRKAIQLDRRLTLREIIEKIFGGLDKFKSKDELLEEEIAKFVSIHRPDAAHMPQIRLFFKAYVTDSEIRDIVETREFNRLATNPKLNLSDYRSLNNWRDVIPEYVKDYVPLNQFMN
jgi:type I restriction enzyme R subunit